MTTSYPKPDRSTFKPNFKKTAENDALDIGWTEGVLSDGRPYRMEFWCQDQFSIVTFFLSTIDLDLPNPPSMRAFLEREGLARFLRKDDNAVGGRYIDSAGNEMWSINLVLGDEDSTFVDVPGSLRKYEK